MRQRASGLASFFALLALSIGAVAYADAIQKWRTPEGELYFGDRPPAGSTLLETVPDTPAPAAVSDRPVESTELERAAAEGRDIIRRREEGRAAERQAEAERDLWQDQLEASVAPDYYDSPIWVVETRPPCAPGEPCFDGGRHHHDHHGHHHHRRHDDWRADRGLSDWPHAWTEPHPWAQQPAQSSKMMAPPRMNPPAPVRPQAGGAPFSSKSIFGP